MRHRAARISLFPLDPTGREAGRWSVRRRWESHVMRRAWLPVLPAERVRHEGYARGGDTTLGLYKLQVVAVE